MRWLCMPLRLTSQQSCNGWKLYLGSATPVTTTAVLFATIGFGAWIWALQFPLRQRLYPLLVKSYLIYTLLHGA